MGKSCSEVGAVDGTVPRGFGRVKVFATAAEEFDRFLVWDVC